MTWAIIPLWVRWFVGVFLFGVLLGLLSEILDGVWWERIL